MGARFIFCGEAFDSTSLGHKALYMHEDVLWFIQIVYFAWSRWIASGTGSLPPYGVKSSSAAIVSSRAAVTVAASPWSMWTLSRVVASMNGLMICVIQTGVGRVGSGGRLG